MAILKRILSDEFPSRIPQVRFYRMPQNSGLAAVRYFGYRMAKGDYVVACDSDDEVVLNAYQAMYEKAIAEDLDIVVCDYYVVKDDCKSVRAHYADAGKEVQSIFWGRSIGTLWCRMFRRRVLDGITPAVGNMTEDIVISVQAICNSRRIGYINEPLYYYCLRNDSISLASGKRADLSRREESNANARLVVDLLVNRYGFDENDPAIVYFKYRNRSALKAYVQYPEYYREWRNTFPEIDHRFLITPRIPLVEKFWFVLIHLHLFYPWKAIMNALRNRAHGRKTYE